MQRKISILLLVALMGCSTTQQTTEQTKWKPTYRVQAGANKGGITENTDMKVVPNAEVDAYSGATKTGFNAGGRVILPLKRNAVETGVDFMYNNQTFTYNDATNGYSGTRKVGTSQVMIPVTYSIPFFRKSNPQGSFQVKLGYLAQINMFNVSSSGTNLPAYSTKAFSNGFTLGVSTTPFRLKNGAKVGLFFEGYRGTQVYEDFYNKTDFEMPGTSFMKYGIIYEF